MSAVTPVFRGFDPYTPMDIYQRHLPHWRQSGATYFVTLRLGDSIPRQVLLRWIDEDTMWLKAHGIDGALTEPRWRAVFNALPQSERILFEKVAGRRLHLELDRCHGSCLLRQYEARKAVVEAFNHFHGRRWWVGDFVVMPNHVHGLFQPLTDSDGAEHRPTEGCTLEAILGSVKGFASLQLTKMGIKSGKFWQQESYDRLVRDRKELYAWRNYIKRNPVKAGLRENEYSLQLCNWLDDET